MANGPMSLEGLFEAYEKAFKDLEKMEKGRVLADVTWLTDRMNDEQ